MRKTKRILSAMLALILTLTMSMGGTVSVSYTHLTLPTN